MGQRMLLGCYIDSVDHNKHAYHKFPVITSINAVILELVLLPLEPLVGSKWVAVALFGQFLYFVYECGMAGRHQDQVHVLS
jgi:hypothetical protein